MPCGYNSYNKQKSTIIIVNIIKCLNIGLIIIIYLKKVYLVL